jgi:hypothetical protein
VRMYGTCCTFMCVCTYVLMFDMYVPMGYVHIGMYVHMYVCLDLYMYVRASERVYSELLNFCMCLHYIRWYVCTYVRTYLCSMYVCMYLWVMWVWLYVYIVCTYHNVSMDISICTYISVVRMYVLLILYPFVYIFVYFLHVHVVCAYVRICSHLNMMYLYASVCTVCTMCGYVRAY